MSEASSDLAACAHMLRAGSKSFAAAARLLPRRVREPATALYAFCRAADDAVDLGADSSLALAELNLRLDRVYAGTPGADAVDRAFANMVARFRIPREIPQALFEGFEWDSTGRRYETIGDLEAYGVRVAGTVGVMMAMIMGVQDPGPLARACDLGIAMQLTNIARDVGEDAHAGRLYLPRQWLREAGVDPEAFLASPAFSPALAGVVERLLDAASVFYRRGRAGVADLPADCRPAIHAARLIYAGIGHEIARAGFDSVSRRARVSSRRKLALIAQAVAAAMLRSPRETAPAAVSARPLLAAVAASLPQSAQVAGPAGFDQKLARTIAVLARMDGPRRVVPRRLGRLAAHGR